uniref:Endoglucanase n=1 Tax=Amitermes foreli TaxID=1249902 RepID=A0A075BRA2_9NEOP|nr:endo-beta-1,4-glucanase 1 [Amitermes foreli]
MRVFFCLLSALALCQTAYHYKQVLRHSLLFYEAQRSGRLPQDQKVTWRKDSALNDQGEQGQDLTGGYFDAGDFVKFGFPMAATATVLAWGLIDFEAGYSSAGALDDGRKAVKWATDYFIKAHTSQSEFYGQVGQGDLDHAYWGRPEDMTMARPAYKIDMSRPGSDLAGETAAALAASSIVFKNVDGTYSNNLLTHARQLFDFAKNYRGKYSDSITDARNFYASADYRDELVWAAAWLYSATNDSSYLNTAESLYNEFGLLSWGGGLNWDSKVSGVQVLLAKLTNKQEYKDTIQSYVNYLINNQQKTPKGLLYIDKWGTLRHAANAAFIMLEAADLGLTASSYRQFAQTQIDYALGDGGRSFVCGFGSNPPTHPHHRSSSCPPAPATCDWNTFNISDPNYNVPSGALVGGPDQNDNYEDDRSDYVHNEVATDYNAGFQSALADLVALGY